MSMDIEREEDSEPPEPSLVTAPHHKIHTSQIARRHLPSLDRLEQDAEKRQLLARLLNYSDTHSAYDFFDLRNEQERTHFLAEYRYCFGELKVLGLDLLQGRSLNEFSSSDWFHALRLLESRRTRMRYGTFDYRAELAHPPLGELSLPHAPGSLHFERFMEASLPGFHFQDLSYRGPVARLAQRYLKTDVLRVTPDDPRAFVAFLRHELLPVLERSLHAFATIRFDYLMERLMIVRESIGKTVDWGREMLGQIDPLVEHSQAVDRTQEAYEKMIVLVGELRGAVFPVPGLLDSSQDKAQVSQKMERMVKLLQEIDATGKQMSETWLE